MKRASVVIITRNRREEALACVAHALALPEAPPVIVVDNGSADGTTPAIKRAHPRVKMVRLPFNLGAAARNVGVDRADTPYVAFCDDDARWEPGALSLACGLLDMFPRIGLVAARVLVGDEGREDPVSREMAQSPLPSAGLPGRSVLGFLAGASVVRRSAFLEAGGFEPRFMVGGEEGLLAYDMAAAGWQLVYNDHVVSRHHPSPQRDAGARRRVQARNAVWLAWLRRPLGSALRITAERLRSAPEALADALRDLGWVLRNRRVLPPGIEASCRLLETSRR